MILIYFQWSYICYLFCKYKSKFLPGISSTLILGTSIEDQSVRNPTYVKLLFKNELILKPLMVSLGNFLTVQFNSSIKEMLVVILARQLMLIPRQLNNTTIQLCSYCNDMALDILDFGFCNKLKSCPVSCPVVFFTKPLTAYSATVATSTTATTDDDKSTLTTFLFINTVNSVFREVF